MPTEVFLYQRRPRLTSLVPRIRRSKLLELQALARRTRVSASVYWREAIRDVLVKHGVEVDGE